MKNSSKIEKLLIIMEYVELKKTIVPKKTLPVH